MELKLIRMMMSMIMMYNCIPCCMMSIDLFHDVGLGKTRDTFLEFGQGRRVQIRQETGHGQITHAAFGKGSIGKTRGQKAAAGTTGTHAATTHIGSAAVNSSSIRGTVITGGASRSCRRRRRSSTLILASHSRGGCRWFRLCRTTPISRGRIFFLGRRWSIAKPKFLIQSKGSLMMTAGPQQELGDGGILYQQPRRCVSLAKGLIAGGVGRGPRRHRFRQTPTTTIFVGQGSQQVGNIKFLTVHIQTARFAVRSSRSHRSSGRWEAHF